MAMDRTHTAQPPVPPAGSAGKPPRYYILRLFLVPGIIYLLLVGNIFINIAMNRLPEYMESPRFQRLLHGELIPALTENSEKALPRPAGEPPLPRRSLLAETLAGQISAVILSLLLGFLLNLPFGLYFHRRRRGRPVPRRITQLVRRRLTATPFLNAGLVLISLNVLHIIQGFYQPKEILLLEQNLFRDMMPVSLISGVLAALFTYFWQRYRVQMLYIQHVFPPEELLRRRNTSRIYSFQLRLWISTLMTTLFPLITVTLYIFYNISSIDNIRTLTAGQLELLSGEIIPAARALGQYDTYMSWLKTQTGFTTILYMTAPGTLRLIVSIVTGISVVMVYIIFFVRWTSKLLIEPVHELLAKMEETGSGHFDSQAVVRTADEIGHLAERFNEMQQGLADRERVKTLFGQYLTAEVSEAILGGEVDLEGQMVEATILFADIRNFTGISERLSPRETVALLNEYLNHMIEVILQEEGIIDKFIGDGLLAVFGAPVQSEKHREQAVRAALAMHEKLADMNRRRQSQGRFPLSIGIGIHTGPVIAGNLGNQNKLEYTVIGDTVNLASRIETLTKQFQAPILVSQATWEALPSSFKGTLEYTPRNSISVRGKQEKVNLIEIARALQ